MRFALPIVLAALAATCLAWSSVLQHEGVGRAGAGEGTVRGRVLAALARDRTWLTGTGLLFVGVGLHLAAVTLAPVSLVQPIGVLAVPLTVCLAARRAGRSDPRYPAAWVAVAGTVGLVAVTSTAVTAPASIDLGSVVWVAAILLPFAGLLALLGLGGPRGRRGAALAAAAGAAYGFATALVRGVAVLVEAGGLHRPADLPQIVGLAGVAAACFGIGAWLVQQAYLVGTAETVMGTLTVADPLAAVVVGLVTLGEGATVSTGAWIAMGACAVVAILGVAALSRPRDEATASDDDDPPGPTAPARTAPHRLGGAARDRTPEAEPAVVWAPATGFAPTLLPRARPL